MTLFHRQTGGLGAMTETVSWSPALVTSNPPVRVSRQVLQTADGKVPVMVFRRDIPVQGGPVMSVEVGLRREALGGQQRTASAAVASMYHLALLASVTAFTLCLGVLVWAAHRDRRREERRRQEEHLAFSGALANGIVHDFRNPMSAVRLDAQMLDRETQRGEGPRPERLRELAGRIGRTMDRMDAVFREFLYLAQPPGERWESVDVEAAVRECVETMAPRFEQAGIGVTVSWTERPPRVRAVATSLKRALVNVLVNALQFSPPRGTVDVAGGRARPEEVWVEIRDRGPGIPEKDRRRVFEMFTTTRPGGTGLGLFLARTAVLNCGGEIAALPREGGGTAIRIVLPALKDDGRAAGPEVRTAAGPAAGAVGAGGIRTE
jgi:signal transduction histidine kinase